MKGVVDTSHLVSHIPSFLRGMFVYFFMNIFVYSVLCTLYCVLTEPGLFFDVRAFQPLGKWLEIPIAAGYQGCILAVNPCHVGWV